MGNHKLSDKEKVVRIKREVSRALREVKFGANRAEVLGSVTMNLCMILSIVETTKDDPTGILFLAAQIATEVEKKEQKPFFPPEGTQLQLGETRGVLDEQQGKDTTPKTRK